MPTTSITKSMPVLHHFAEEIWLVDGPSVRGDWVGSVSRGAYNASQPGLKPALARAQCQNNRANQRSKLGGYHANRQLR